MVRFEKLPDIRAPADQIDTTEYWYRYHDTRVGHHAFADIPVMSIWLDKIPVVKHTKKGVWLAWGGQGVTSLRFVLNDSHKQWACPTIEAARASFIARKRRQLVIYTDRMSHASESLRMAFKGEWPA